jgi:CRISPR-associated protein Cas2
MAEVSKWFLVCYDVREPRRLRIVAKHLQGYGTRVQYSVFRCWLSPSQAERLRWELTERLTVDDDILMIPLCARCIEGVAGAHKPGKGVGWPEKPPSHRIV